MKRQKSFYDMLGVDRTTATTGQIDAGYKATFERIKKEFQSEPLKFEEALLDINRAHKTLINYELKADYDRMLDEQEKKRELAPHKQVQKNESPDKIAERIVNSANAAVEAHRADKIRSRFVLIMIFVAIVGLIFYFFYTQGSKTDPSSAKRDSTKAQKVLKN